MSSRSIRFGVIYEESADKGPYKLAKVMSDGKVMDLEIMDIAGVEGSPLKDSRVIIFTPDGDDAKAIGIAFGPAVKDRTDGQSPGDVTYKNHKSGNVINHDKDGNTNITTPSGTLVNIAKDGTVGVKPGAGKNVYLGDIGSGSKVVTVAGPSANVYAKV